MCRFGPRRFDCGNARKLAEKVGICDNLLTYEVFGAWAAPAYPDLKLDASTGTCPPVFAHFR